MNKQDGLGGGTIVMLWIVLFGVAGGVFYMRTRPKKDESTTVTKAPEERPRRPEPRPTAVPAPSASAPPVPEMPAVPEVPEVPTVEPPAAPPTGSDASAVVARNRWRFRACFTKALATDPAAGGKVEVSVTLDADGNVSDAKASSTTCSTDLTACVVDSFKMMKFAAPEGGSGTLSIPIVLTGAK